MVTTPGQAPRPRYFGPGHLAAASVFGGVGACCWLMASNEALRERGPWLPWQPIAFLFVTCEGIAHVLMWRGVLPHGWLLATWLVPLLALLVVAARRYAAWVPRTRPAEVVDAVSVGWGFCLVRIVLAVGLYALALA